MRNMRKKQFLVIGLGRFGSSVAVSLCKLGHEVLAVDKEQAPVDAISTQVTQAISADVTDEEVLKSLDPGSFDAAVVAVGSGVRDSILIAVLLKEMNVPYVVAKANDDLHAKVLSKVGVDKVIFPERDMGKRLANSLCTMNFMDMIAISEDCQLVEMMPLKQWCGQTLLESNIRRNYGVSIVAIRRNGELIVSPGADTSLEETDVLLVVGTTRDVEKIMDE